MFRPQAGRALASFSMLRFSLPLLLNFCPRSATPFSTAAQSRRKTRHLKGRWYQVVYLQLLANVNPNKRFIGFAPLLLFFFV